MSGRIIGSALVVAAFLLPVALGATDYAVYVEHIAVQIMLLGLLAMSWDFIFGYLGMFSFGHAAFFGIGAYTAGILIARLDVTFLPLVIVAALGAAALAGLFVGYLCSRVGSVAVFLVTFACAEALYLVILSDPHGYTAGDNGLLGIMPEPVLGINLRNETLFYYISLVVLLGSYLSLLAITRSQFGQVMIGIKENELRIRFAGYRVEQYKAAAFGISGFFAGLAGMLTAFHERIAAPEMAGWLYSAEAVLYATLGGFGTLIGPVLGAGIVIVIRELVSDYIDSWLIIVAVAYILLIFFLPGGIHSLVFRRTPSASSESSAFLAPLFRVVSELGAAKKRKAH